MPTAQIVAADLVPWWFAAAFWVAFCALVVIVVRDVRRAGGARAVLEEIQAAIEMRGQDPEQEKPNEPDLDEDPAPHSDRER